MSRLLIVPIGDLTPVAVTRARGAKAFEALMDVVRQSGQDASVVLVDTSGAKIVSGSFLDELVVRIDQIHETSLPKIGFRVNSGAEEAKLERVCSLRKIKCTYQRWPDSTLKTTQVRRKPQPRVASYPGSFFS